MKNSVKEKIEEIISKWNEADYIQKNYVMSNTQKYLKDTDYIIIKIQEYSLLNKEIDNDYTEILQEREYCRKILRSISDDELE